MSSSASHEISSEGRHMPIGEARGIDARLAHSRAEYSITAKYYFCADVSQPARNRYEGASRNTRSNAGLKIQLRSSNFGSLRAATVNLRIRAHFVMARRYN